MVQCVHMAESKFNHDICSDDFMSEKTNSKQRRERSQEQVMERTTGVARS